MKLRTFVLPAAAGAALVLGAYWALADPPAAARLPVRPEARARPYVYAPAGSLATPQSAPAPTPVTTATGPAADTVRGELAITATSPLPPRRVTPTVLPTVPSVAFGQLLIPVSGIKRTDLVDTYTQARSGGRRHDAIDIAASRGTPVVAVAKGSIVKLYTSARGGIALYQLAADGRTVFYYAHLDRYAAGITNGRMLRQGEVIGYVGDTGNAGAGNYHLHFEVSTTPDPKRYWGGAPQNPYPLLH